MESEEIESIIETLRGRISDEVSQLEQLIRSQEYRIDSLESSVRDLERRIDRL